MISLKNLTRVSAAGVAAVLATGLAGVAPLASHAATMKSMGMSHSHKMAQPVYICTKCHEYFSPAAAKKMGYKDSMGHHLVKAGKAPAGYANGAKMNMGGMKSMGDMKM